MTSLTGRSLSIILSLLVMGLVACKKTASVKPHSYVYVRLAGNEEYSYMEDVEGSVREGRAELHSNGTHNEQFALRLAGIKDTGNILNPGLDNLYFSNGDDFFPMRFVSGSIHISYADSVTVLGDFNVVLEDDYNGADTKTVTGSFGINVP
jgi:hypothetical protein